MSRDSDIIDSDYFDSVDDRVDSVDDRVDLVHDSVTIVYNKHYHILDHKSIKEKINNILCERRCKNSIFRNRCKSTCSNRSLINFLIRIINRIIKITKTTLHTSPDHYKILEAYETASAFNQEKTYHVEAVKIMLNYKNIVFFLNDCIKAYKENSFHDLIRLYIFLLCLEDLNIFAKYQLYGGSRKLKKSRKTRIKKG